jgi:hypothetical protein
MSVFSLVDSDAAHHSTWSSDPFSQLNQMWILIVFVLSGTLREDVVGKSQTQIVRRRVAGEGEIREWSNGTPTAIC